MPMSLGLDTMTSTHSKGFIIPLRWTNNGFIINEIKGRINTLSQSNFHLLLDRLIDKIYIGTVILLGLFNFLDQMGAQL